ncbi:allantoin racemase [Poseidonocella pacifica]|uniref:Allantoin racemase n=2 Tax=Poseidonocella pacifica TaxID=871651 RepID=A0A1I0W8S2_9RHOB|nr:allantoin racemase [Poseidonocella pacifica]
MNPNSTEAMTDSMVSVARETAPGAEVLGWTNHLGPPSIQGLEDGAAAVEGLLALLPEARAAAADAIFIGCFDDTGLGPLQAAAHCPVIGTGQAGMSLAALHSGRFGIVTTLDVSVLVIAANVEVYGHRRACVGVFASDLPVLEVERGGQNVEDRLARAIPNAEVAGADAVVLGCAGMSRLRRRLSARTGSLLIDGVVPAAFSAQGLACR